ncbi:MAG: SRPBCC family protein [Candidatus Kariarchaeaceae archaeon]|jgi:activator of HSP90 ATPase
MTKTIEYTVRFNASPADVFDTLMDSKRHQEFSGQPAEIENKEGGRFSCYGDSLTGETIKLVQNETIVQKWRAKDWDEGVYSDVTYNLAQEGDETVLTFLQTGVPNNEFDKINQGWQMAYWNPMSAYFEK